jgi:hypothetical protein
MSVVSGAMGASASKKAAKKAAAAQDRATESQERIYYQTRSDFEPYRGMGLQAIPYLMSAMTGQSYQTPDSRYTAIDPREIASMNENLTKYDPTQSWYRTPEGQITSSNGIINASNLYSGIDPQFRPTVSNGYEPLSPDEVSMLNKTYNANMKWYRGPDGKIISEEDVPKTSVKFEPGQSPAAQYQLRQGNIAMGRALGARGQAGSGGAAYKLGELSKNVAASDWQDQYNRLLDMVKVGTGASSATGSAATTLSNAYGAGAQNLGNIYGNQGATMASLYGGTSGNAMAGLGAGLQAYKTGQSLGWWGAPAATSSFGAAAQLGSSYVAPTAATEAYSLL